MDVHAYLPANKQKLHVSGYTISNTRSHSRILDYVSISQTIGRPYGSYIRQPSLYMY